MRNTDDNSPWIIIISGPNGAGKTTLIGKMAYMFKQQGKKVLIAAGDTFRAAAEEQADIWSKRSGADIVRRDKADPASVVYEAIQKARNENYDVILVDTAGRLHNKKYLMDELNKIQKVINKEMDEADKEVLLVIDGTTGQNAISQVEVFNQIVPLSGLVITKLDGSAKGGILTSIAQDFNIPVYYVGVGEQIEDLDVFKASEYSRGLLGL